MLPYPHINPTLVHIGAFQIRWYAVAYVLSFVLGYIFVRRTMKQRGVNISNDDYENLLFVIMLGVILGGRLGYVLFYNLGYYLRHPLEIILPFDVANGFQFTGIMGMSFHGGALGVIIAGLWFARRHHMNFYRLADPTMPWVAVGLFLGRMGNFINGELYGRVTSFATGMIFPDAEGLPLQSPQAQSIIGKLGWSVHEAMHVVTTASGKVLPDVLTRGWTNTGQYATLVNLPRHPSQLYEAFSEGLLMAVILFVLLRVVKREGVVFWAFIGLYGLFRFFIEFVRQPDAHLGFVLGPFTRGQELCAAMMIAAVVGIILLLRGKRADA